MSCGQFAACIAATAYAVDGYAAPARAYAVGGYVALALSYVRAVGMAYSL